MAAESPASLPRSSAAVCSAVMAESRVHKRSRGVTAHFTLVPLITVLVGCVLLFVLVALQDRVPVGDLTRDLAATTESAWYIGSVSSVGALGWAAAAAVSGLAAVALTGKPEAISGRRSLTIFAVLSVVLALDDVLLLHDDLLLRLFGSELPVYSAYAIVGAAFLVYSRRIIPRHAKPTLAVALVSMGGSVLVDIMWVSDSESRLLTEDGLKFLGIWTWALFAAIYALHLLDRDIANDA